MLQAAKEDTVQISTWSFEFLNVHQQGHDPIYPIGGMLCLLRHLPHSTMSQASPGDQCP